MSIETVVSKNRFHWEMNGPHVEVHDTEHLTNEMRYALSIIERWAMVSGTPNGEDSAGRQRLKLMPVTEVVERAFEIARLAFARGREEGLIAPLPTLAELREELGSKESVD